LECASAIDSTGFWWEKTVLTVGRGMDLGAGETLFGAKDAVVHCRGCAG